MSLGQDTVLLFIVLRTLDRSLNLGLLGDLAPDLWGAAKLNPFASQKEVRAHIVVLILSDWSHFYYS